MSSLLAELLSGAIFGSALFASGVYDPAVIRAQMRFESNVMVRVFMAASATSAIVFDLAHRWGFAPKTARAPVDLGLFRFDGNIIGGALIGIGMTVSGACPGTSLVQAGIGSKNGALVMLGGIIGAYAFVKLQPYIEKSRSRNCAESASASCEANEEKDRDIASAVGVSQCAMLVAWLLLCIGVICGAGFLDGGRARRPTSTAVLVPTNYGGLLIGVAQLATNLIAGHSLGASRGYEHVARWIDERFTKVERTGPIAHPAAWCTPSVVFATGIVVASAALSHVFPPAGVRSTSVLTTGATLEALAGGISMILGARMAGGCTSGHGISGLAKFSLASLVTTIAIFASGVATAISF